MSKITPDALTEPIGNDSLLLKHLVDFESEVLRERKKAGEPINGFTNETVALIQDDFSRFKDLLGGVYSKQALELSRQKGHYFLSKGEIEEFRKIPKSNKEERTKFLEEKAFPRVYPLWYLVVSLCRLLQRGEHDFSASDAWWFGLVDEVIGTDLPSIRLWNEARIKKRKTAESAKAASSTIVLKLPPSQLPTVAEKKEPPP